MNSSFILLSLLTFSTLTHGTVTVIPKAVQDLKSIENFKKIKLLRQNSKLEHSRNFEQVVTPANWFNLAPSQGAEGVSSDLAYGIFGIPQGKEIIVAVIDSGVDVNHEDLQGKIWINKNEIANDGIDNDNNGYTDDIFGWNFIGSKEGMAKIVSDPTSLNQMKLIEGDPRQQVGPDTLEVTRELVRLEKKKNSGAILTSDEKIELEKATNEVTDAVAKATTTIQKYSKVKKNFNDASKVLKDAGVDLINPNTVSDFNPTNEEETKAKAALIAFFNLGISMERIERILSYYQDQLDFFYNKNFNPRKIVGDNYDDLSEKFYGNNNVIGPEADHGTHVSGIIAADRANNLGIKGVASNVKIMAIRCIPNGDERDKDVANAIRYAVDNGANIINMSFGKNRSPFKKTSVDEAVFYAQKNGVLLVHAAGNSNQDNNTAPNFPNRILGKNIFGKTKEAKNWLEIGASSFENNENLPATFSNYGSKTVDLFAPGVDILSTTPGNKYDTFSGTSMASPVTAGVAALILSYHPDLRAKELKKIIMENARDKKNIDVKLPGDGRIVKFGTLSISGSVADVLNSMKALD